MTQNILIIGASGRLGLAIIREASKHSSSPSIHAFARTPSKIPPMETMLCTTIQKGDALKPDDITAALKATNPDTIIVAIGVPNSTDPTNLRENSAKALMTALKPDEFSHVRVVGVSSIGAGGSNINVGMGVGSLIHFRLRHLLKDHDAQEDTFWKGVGSETSRVMVVRPVGLIDGKPRGKIVPFGDNERTPAVSIDREEVADFILDQICGSGKFFGRSVNIASTSEQNSQWSLKALLTLV